MSVLVSADFHLSDQPKERYRFKALEFLLDLIAERHVDRFIILGDLTHAKNYHSDVLVNDVVGYLHEFAKLCPVEILQGNHDYTEANNAFFQFVRLLPNIRWIWTPRMLYINGLGLCCFLPHTRNYEKDWAEIRKDWAKSNLIFAHNAFEGAIAETGKRLSGIPLNVFPNIQIISGDIHQPQELGDGRLVYVGSPTTQKYGDDFEPRVLLLDNGGMESIPVPGPQKRLLDVSHIDELKDYANKHWRMNDMVKVRYHLRHEDRERWPEIKKELAEFMGPTRQIVPVLEQSHLPQQVNIQSKDDKQLLREFGEQQRASPSTMVTGYELLTSA